MMEPRMLTSFDHCLHFQVIDKRISCIDDGSPEVVADNRGNICINITFDDQWDGCSKVARFIYNGKWKDMILDENNECICPSEVVKKGRFSLGVYGDNLKTTTPITISVAPSILSESGEELPEAPTDDVYQQILKITAEASESADEATKACWEAVEATNEAAKALNNAKEELENGGFIQSILELNKNVPLSFWVGTQAEYDAIPKKSGNRFYIIVDDNAAEEIDQRISALEDRQFADSKHKNCYYRKVETSQGVAQEWFNPPMEQENEYRLTERMHGYVVYTKLFRITPSEATSGKFSTGGLIFRYHAWTENHILPRNLRSETTYQDFNVHLDGSWNYTKGANVTMPERIWVQAWYYKN